MKVALLVCDKVNPKLIGRFGDYPEMFKEFLPSLELHSFDAYKGEFPAINDFDNFICTGSKHSVYENLVWVKELIDLVKNIHELGKKYFGVCFGHQILGKALGSEVSLSTSEYLIGVHEFNLVANTSQQFNMLMMCQDQVKNLPESAELLASNKVCPVGMFRSRNAIGIQGHPEFSKDYNLALAQLREEKIGNDTIEKAKASFSQDPSSTQMRKWIYELFND